MSDTRIERIAAIIEADHDRAVTRHASARRRIQAKRRAA